MRSISSICCCSFSSLRSLARSLARAWLAPARWGYAATAVTVDLDRSKETGDGQLAPDLERDVLYTASVDQWVLNLTVLVGLLLLPAVGLAWFVLMIVATVKVANHEEFRYPAIIRFVS